MKATTAANIFDDVSAAAVKDKDTSSMAMMLFSKAPNRAIRRARVSHRARFRNGILRAALQALTGAKLYLQGDMTLEQAAISVGSNIRYIMAAVLLIKANDQDLISEVLHGDISILAAAKLVKPQVVVIETLKSANSANLAAIYDATHFTNNLTKLLVDTPPAGRTEAAAKLGANTVWDQMVSPLIPVAVEHV